MNIKSFIFGLGCGLLFMSICFYFVYDAAANNIGEPVTEQLTDTEITNRAKQLGMVFLTEAAANGAANTQKDETDSMTPDDSIPAPIETPYPEEPAGETPVNPEVQTEGEPTESLPDSNASPEEGETGEGTPEDGTPSDGTHDEQPSGQNDNVEETTTEQLSQTQAENTPQTANADDSDMIRIVISDGLTAREVVQILLDEGVIDDYNAFLQHIIDNGAATRLILGTYYFAENESYESIIAKITRY